MNAIDTPSTPRNSWAFYLALCLLGPFFFLSLVFTILAPLPILYLHQGIADRRMGRFWAFLSVAIGISVCLLIKGPAGAFAFVLFAGLPAWALGETLQNTESPGQAVMAGLVSLLLLLGIAGLSYGKIRQIPMIPYTKSLLTQTVKEVSVKLLAAQGTSTADNANEEELKKILAEPDIIVQDFPGIFLMGILLLCTTSMVALLRWNPKSLLRRRNIPRDYLRKWRAPEYLVWPALLTGAFLVFEVPYVSAVANNLLKPLLVIYFLQGLSILSYFLDSMRVRGPLRVIVYGLGFVFFTPMLVSFGFFDLWFNFRGRIKGKQE